MTTALARRLQQVERALDPTQFVVHWLLEAHAYGSLHAYTTALHDQPERNPLVILPRQVATAVRQASKGQPAHAVRQHMESLAQRVLFRAYLVLTANDHLSRERRADELELELLETTLDCLTHGGTVPGRLPAWSERISRLTAETQAWQQASALVGRRYFAGQSPLFPDIAQHLEHVAATCQRLIDRYHAAFGRARGRRAPRIDRAAFVRQGTADAEVVVTQLVRRAEEQVRVFTGQQAGTFRLERLQQDLIDEGAR